MTTLYTVRVRSRSGRPVAAGGTVWKRNYVTAEVPEATMRDLYSRRGELSIVWPPAPGWTAPDGTMCVSEPEPEVPSEPPAGLEPAPLLPDASAVPTVPKVGAADEPSQAEASAAPPGPPPPPDEPPQVTAPPAPEPPPAPVVTSRVDPRHAAGLALLLGHGVAALKAKGIVPAPIRRAPERLLDFIPRISPKFTRPYHLTAMAALIERAVAGEPVRALVSVPPRHGKTECIIHSIPWALDRRPDLLIGYVSYAAELARSKSRSARDLARLTGIPSRDDADALHEWLTPQGGGLRAAGIGGPLTGQGFGLLFIDDPIKNREEAESLIIRSRNYGWFTSTAMTRLDPNGAVIVVHTRWHEDDLIGRLRAERLRYDATMGMEGERWEYVNLPAVNAEGNALWPERWPVEILDKRRRIVGPYDWSALFQGEPRPKEGRLFRDPVRYQDPQIDGARLVIGVDVAGTKKTRSNWTVAVVMAFSGVGEEMCADVLEVLRMQEEVPEVCRRLEALQQKWGAPLVVEASGLGKAVPQMLRDTSPQLDIKEVYPSADKYVRAQAYASAWNEGRVRLPAHGADIAQFIAIHKDFTGVDDPQDDDVDAGAHAWNYQLAGGNVGDYDPRWDDSGPQWDSAGL